MIYARVMRKRDKFSNLCDIVVKGGQGVRVRRMRWLRKQELGINIRISVFICYLVKKFCLKKEPKKERNL